MGAAAAIIENLAIHSLIAIGMVAYTKNPECWFVSAFASLICAIIDIGEVGFHVISGVLTAISRYLHRIIRHIMNSCWARGIATAEVVNTVNAFADLALFGVFMCFGFAGVVL